MRATIATSLCLCFVPIAAQAPLGSTASIRLDVAGVDPAPDSPARTRLDAALRALAAGRAADAVRDALAALELAPASPAVFRALLGGAAAENDARAVFALGLTLALVDDRGRSVLERGDTATFAPDDPWPQRLAQAQVGAFEDVVRELTKLESKGRNALGNGIVARWLADLAIDLGRDMPRLLAARAAAIDGAIAKHQADHATVFEALRKQFTTPTSAGTGSAEAVAKAAIESRDRAMRAARIALGLAAQSRFGKDLKGPPPPDLGALPRDAALALDRLRAEAAQAGVVWTVEQLRALDESQREEFTKTHATWANPGIAESPNKRYRIETVCGFETLLGAAATVEHHHQRLVDWFGSDPFLQRQGLVRIEPEHTGLEANGSPFWWAGGFQSGDVTTLRFAWSNVPSLGRGLTHELTHRFDGTLLPFLPAWAVEGRATWTGANYGPIEDPKFAEDVLDPWAMQGPFVKGYGGMGNFKKLLDGTIDDYRDNYSAGRALFSYLRQAKGADGKPRFRERLDKFQKNARAGRSDPIAYFTQNFADGKEGRPADLDEFVAGFHEFLRQCYRWCWNERDAENEWIKGYRHGLPGDKGYGPVLDAPSLSWARDRAEPWFGQGHAADAAWLFEEAGDHRAAAAAACWSLLVDGWEADRAALAARSLEASGRAEAAWVTRDEMALRADAPLPRGGRPKLLDRLGKLDKLAQQLEQAAAEHRAAQRVVAEGWFLARAERIRRRLGGETAMPNLTSSHSTLVPDFEPPHVLGAFGWGESGLVGYEDRRVPGLWFESGEGDVHVGRQKPRDDTGTIDRAAHQRDAFVHSSEWIAPGRYIVRARIHFTTSFISGAMLVGYMRRDRNIRIHFSAGDFLFAIGRKDEDGKTKSVNLRLDGTWEREHHMTGSRPSRGIEFEQPSSHVDIEVHVDGPSLEVFAMGKPAFRYTTVDLSPIEGHVGFAMGQGAVRVQTPTVQRLDRDRLPREVPQANNFPDLHQRVMPGAPRSPNGTIVVWIPKEDDEEFLLESVEHWLRAMQRNLRDTLAYPQPWAIMVAESTPPETRAKLATIAKDVAGRAMEVVTDPRKGVTDEDIWVLFVDARGVLRVARSGGETALPREVAHWARRYRSPSN
ncbi:MAG: hypothetical protein AB7I19_12135 [Planctomycetota bacterium]